MAIYHCSVKIIGRSSGRSSVASAAYRAGEKLYNARDGMTHDYSKRENVVYSEILLPKNAPQEFLDRQTLWNAVEKIEKRSDSQTAREFELAIPIEFNRPEGIQVIKDYVSKNFVDKGMCADIAIHDNDGNPHAHIMLTMRPVSEKGFGSKMGASRNEWNSKKQFIEWRKEWAVTCNEHLKVKGFQTRIDHRTLEAQGIDREPTTHIGATATQMQKKGKAVERWEINIKIIQRNKELNKINVDIKELKKQRNNMEIEYMKSNDGQIQTIETPQKAVDIRQYNRERQARILENLNEVRRTRPPREERNRAMQETTKEIEWDR